MIRVPKIAPPPNYEADVRNPGRNFLNSNPNPTAADFKRHQYWREIHTYLHDESKRLCAYSASWIPRAQDPAQPNHSSVDHFLPKSHYPELAYSWENFLIARRDVNESKDDDLNIIDPREIPGTPFQLDFDSCRIHPSPTTNALLQARIRHTITTLRLNEEPLIDERTNVISEFAHNRLSLSDLDDVYPFVASEARRQDVDGTLKARLRLAHFDFNPI